MKPLRFSAVVPRIFIGIFFLLLTITTLFLGLKVAADGTVKSFNSKKALQPGIAVSLVKGSKDAVEPLPSNSSNLIYGVVVDPSDTPLTIKKTDSQVFVASSGSFPLLVSTQNGAINRGDYLASSSIEGIAAKASIAAPVIIGRAEEDFKGGGAAIFTASDGSAVGRILAQIAPGDNPEAVTSAAVPGALKKIGESIAGKNVSPLRIYGAVGILFIGIIAMAILILGGIRTGMNAIGRNPLSKKSIMKSLIQVVLVAILVFVATLMGIYLLLKL